MVAGAGEGRCCCEGVVLVFLVVSWRVVDGFCLEAWLLARRADPSRGRAVRLKALASPGCESWLVV